MIVRYPDKVLRQVCALLSTFPVDESLIERMLLELKSVGGAALAANQVGVLQRFFVVSPDIASDNGTHVFVGNPSVIRKSSRTIRENEGCLSLPGVKTSVERSSEITIRGVDQQGYEFEETVDGFLARCYQHEIDHLDGKLMIDSLSHDRRMSIASKMKSYR